MEPVVTGMSAIISNIGLWVTGILQWLGSIFTFVTAEGHEWALVPLILACVAIGIHWFKLLTRG